MNLRKLKLTSFTVVAFIFCELLFNIIFTSIPFLTNLLIESIINKNEKQIIFLVIIVTLLAFFSAILNVITTILDRKVEYELEYKLKKVFLDNNKNYPIDKFSNYGFKNNYLYNSKEVVKKYLLMKIDIFIYTFVIISSLLFYALISWQIAIIAFALNIVTIIIIFILKNKVSKVQKDYSKNRKDFIKDSSKIFNGASDLLAFNRIEAVVPFLNKANSAYYKKNKIVNKRDIFYSSLIRSSSIIMTSLIILIIIIMSKYGIISLYVVISLLVSNTTLALLMSNIFDDLKSLKSMNKLIDNMNIFYEEEKEEDKQLFPICTKSLVLNTRNKSFNYPEICIKKNMKYFLRGNNGVGKSLLINAIQGIVNLNKGNIKYNIYNRQDLNVRTISSKIICLNSKPLIFKGSIIDNLFISEQKWINITNEFNFITKNFKDCNLDASLLSLGQKQMIALLRSLIFNKELIIIDEGLDAVSKTNRDNIESYLDSLNKSIIYVSHTNHTTLDWEEIRLKQ